MRTLRVVTDEDRRNRLGVRDAAGWPTPDRAQREPKIDRALYTERSIVTTTRTAACCVDPPFHPDRGASTREAKDASGLRQR